MYCMSPMRIVSSTGTLLVCLLFVGVSIPPTSGEYILPSNYARKSYFRFFQSLERIQTAGVMVTVNQGPNGSTAPSPIVQVSTQAASFGHFTPWYAVPYPNHNVSFELQARNSSGFSGAISACPHLPEGLAVVTFMSGGGGEVVAVCVAASAESSSARLFNLSPAFDIAVGGQTTVNMTLCGNSYVAPAIAYGGAGPWVPAPTTSPCDIEVIVTSSTPFSTTPRITKASKSFSPPPPPFPFTVYVIGGSRDPRIVAAVDALVPTSTPTSSVAQSVSQSRATLSASLTATPCLPPALTVFPSTVNIANVFDQPFEVLLRLHDDQVFRQPPFEAPYRSLTESLLIQNAALNAALGDRAARWVNRTTLQLSLMFSRSVNSYDTQTVTVTLKSWLFACEPLFDASVTILAVSVPLPFPRPVAQASQSGALVIALLHFDFFAALEQPRISQVLSQGLCKYNSGMMLHWPQNVFLIQLDVTNGSQVRDHHEQHAQTLFFAGGIVSNIVLAAALILMGTVAIAIGTQIQGCSSGIPSQGSTAEEPMLATSFANAESRLPSTPTFQSNSRKLRFPGALLPMATVLASGAAFCAVFTALHNGLTVTSLVMASLGALFVLLDLVVVLWTIKVALSTTGSFRDDRMVWAICLREHYGSAAGREPPSPHVVVVDTTRSSGVNTAGLNAAATRTVFLADSYSDGALSMIAGAKIWFIWFLTHPFVRRPSRDVDLYCFAIAAFRPTHASRAAFVVLVVLTMTANAIDGVQPMSPTACVQLTYAIASLNAVITVMLLILRPFAIPARNALSISTAALTTTACIVTVLAMLHESFALQQLAATLAMVAQVASVAGLCIIVIANRRFASQWSPALALVAAALGSSLGGGGALNGSPATMAHPGGGHDDFDDNGSNVNADRPDNRQRHLVTSWITAVRAVSADAAVGPRGSAVSEAETMHTVDRDATGVASPDLHDAVVPTDSAEQTQVKNSILSAPNDCPRLE